MTNAFAAYNVLYANDKNCAEYIAKFQDIPKTSEAKTETVFDLKTLITLGFKDETYASCKKLLESENSLDIINSFIIPALDDVGRDYESGKIYLPNLLSSAEAAQNAFAAIKEVSKSGEKSGNRILLATVYGDIHDIGKNIVKTVLENYSELKRVVAEEVPSVTLFLGSELLVRDNIHEVLGNNDFFSINGSRYLLAEFAFDEKISR